MVRIGAGSESIGEQDRMNIKGFAKKAAIAVILLCLAGVAGVVAFSMRMANYANTPLDPQGLERTFEVSRGKGLSAVAHDLEEQGLASHPGWFSLLARIQKTDAKIHAGEYILSPDMTPLEILNVLVKGRTVLYRLTVPEGVTMVQIAALAAQAGFGPEEEFLDKASDPAFAASLGVEQETLEGYLFPDTYYFNKGASPEKVITTMVQRFHTVFKPEWEDRAEELGMTVHQVVTLASIIEKETSVPDERALVSSVNHNRLKKGIKLQSDPTVIYGIKEFDGNITRKHLETPTPYNTYTSKGLPPGPIASPGEAALHAALYPAETDYLFFVAKGDGGHQFSTNLRDHNRAVRKYQLRR